MVAESRGLSATRRPGSQRARKSQVMKRQMSAARSCCAAARTPDRSAVSGYRAARSCRSTTLGFPVVLTHAIMVEPAKVLFNPAFQPSTPGVDQDPPEPGGKRRSADPADRAAKCDDRING